MQAGNYEIAEAKIGTRFCEAKNTRKMLGNRRCSRMKKYKARNRWHVRHI